MAHTLNKGNDGILRLAVIGDLDLESAKALAKELLTFVEAATEGEPVLLLAQATLVGKVSASARRFFAHMYRGPHAAKTAVVGADRYVRVLVGFVLKATGRDTVVHFFEGEEQAVAWLRDEQ